MIYSKLIIIALNFFDFFQQKKILNILKKKLKGRLIIFDVGAHHGETIKNFANNFDIDEIHSFEASRVNFKKLEKITQKFQQKKIILNNIGLSDNKKEILINQFSESSSTTLSKVNEKSKYFLKKINILGLSKNKNFYETLKVKLETLDDYLKEKDIQKIDLLKIDTEGYELNVLKGLSDNSHKIKLIYFEHHYDDMIVKNYKFGDIHNFLRNKGFKMIKKSKMIFRKSFEYVYENQIIQN